MKYLNILAVILITSVSCNQIKPTKPEMNFEEVLESRAGISTWTILDLAEYEDSGSLFGTYESCPDTFLGTTPP